MQHEAYKFLPTRPKYTHIVLYIYIHMYSYFIQSVLCLQYSPLQYWCASGKYKKQSEASSPSHAMHKPLGCCVLLLVASPCDDTLLQAMGKATTFQRLECQTSCSAHGTEHNPSVHHLPLAPAQHLRNNQSPHFNTMLMMGNEVSPCLKRNVLTLLCSMHSNRISCIFAMPL